ncbi:hypothetical protein BDF19DRAFT_446105 [Syncephalis fuscata]|nr:hypothetical protein BDF19DRAFT_446105 [Syncephalis fuscata]
MSLYAQLATLAHQPPSEELFDSLIALYRSTANTFRTQPAASLGLLRVCARRVDTIARLVDAQTGNKRCHERWTQEASNLFNFAALREEGNSALLLLAGLLLQIYFRLKMFKSCDRIVSAVESANVSMDKFPRSERIMYQYYYGRYLLNQHRVNEAVDTLQNAFLRCSRHAFKNKRRILIYLMVAAMLTDRLPSPTLLVKYQLDAPFINLIREMRRGNLAGYFRELATYSAWHTNYGNLMLLHQRGMVMVYRYLFRRVYVLQGLSNVDKPRLLLNDLVTACALSVGKPVEPEHDEDEVIFLIASMIQSKYIRGYISITHRLLITARGSAEAAFPPIRSR